MGNIHYGPRIQHLPPDFHQRKIAKIYTIQGGAMPPI